MCAAPTTFLVRVCVHEARDIPNCYEESGGAPYAYVKINWNGQKFKTDIDKTHRWNKEFLFPWNKRDDKSTMEIDVWSSFPGAHGRHSSLGYVPIDLNSLRLNDLSCAFYGLLKFPNSPSFGAKHPVLKLGIELINQLNDPKCISGFPTQTNSKRPGDGDWIERIAEDNPSATREEVEEALQRANFHPDLALQILSEILVNRLANGNSSESPVFYKASTNSLYSSSSSSSSSSEEETTNGKRNVYSHKQEYKEKKKRAKTGDKEAKDWIKENDRESKKTRKDEKRDVSKHSKKADAKNSDARKRKEEKHYNGCYEVVGTTRKLSIPVEDRLQELFPYFKLEQIKKVLVKHNHYADLALDELLDTRFQEVGQTAIAQMLDAHDDHHDLVGTTFVDFVPILQQAVVPTPEYHEFVAPVLDTGKKKALLIGIDYIGTSKQLRGCIEDTKQIRRLLTTVYGFPDNDVSITVLTDNNPKANLNPTKRNILAAFQWLISDTKPGSILFFHYSGHGSQKQNRNKTEHDGFDETIMPCDYATRGQITDDEIYRELVAPLRRGVKLMCLMDCCHSGSAMDLPFIWNVERRKWDVEFRPKYSNGDVQLLSGCCDNEQSAEYFISQDETGGAMTKAFRQAIALNPYGHTYNSLTENIAKFLRTWGFCQTPRLSSSQKFIFDSPFRLTPLPSVAPGFGPQIKPGVPQQRPTFKPSPISPAQNKLAPAQNKPVPNRIQPSAVRPVIAYSPLAPGAAHPKPSTPQYPNHQIYSHPARRDASE